MTFQLSAQRLSTQPSQSVTQTVPISVNINSSQSNPSASVETSEMHRPVDNVKYESTKDFEISRLQSIIKGFDTYISIIRKSMKDKFYLEARDLCEIVKLFTHSDDVALDIETSEDVGCFSSSRLRKINSIFVTQGITTQNLKYNLPEDYKRIQSLGISLKYILV